VTRADIERLGATSMEELFRSVVRNQGSDLFIQEGSPPTYRVNGDVRRLSEESTSAEASQRLFESILDPHQQETFTKRGEADSAFDLLVGHDHPVNVRCACVPVTPCVLAHRVSLFAARPNDRLITE